MNLSKWAIAFLAFFFLLTFTASATNNDSTVVYGKEPQYAGLQLVLEYKSNIISNELTPISNFCVEKDGSFRSSFVITTTSKFSIKLGKSVGTVILEPKGKYKIELPPYNPMVESDKMNPFFTPVIIPLAVSEGDEDGLNRKVANFDDEYNTLYINNLQKLFKRENEAPILEITNYLDSVYSSSNSWFNEYRHFSYYKLYELVFPRRRDFIIDKFFKSSEFRPNNVAYVDAFNLAFFRYFTLKLSSKHEADLKRAWSTKSVDTILYVMKSKKYLVDDELTEAVVLKNLFDFYYSNLYDKNEILELISQCERSFKTSYSINLAKQFYIKLPLLGVGTLPPTFKLESLGGKKRTLRDYKGKFVYLNFMNSQNFACKKDLLTLVEINKITKKELVIVTVLTDYKLDAAKEFVKSNRLDWDFLTVKSQESIVDEYKLRVLPTYFLIDPDGKFNLSPAPSPDESFLSIFQNQIRAFKNQELRENPPKQKSIFDM